MIPTSMIIAFVITALIDVVITKKGKIDMPRDPRDNLIFFKNWMFFTFVILIVALIFKDLMVGSYA